LSLHLLNTQSIHSWGLFFFLLFLLLIFAAIGWVFFTQYRARKAGLPPPSFKSYIPFVGGSARGASASNYPTPRSAGPIEWVKDQLDKLRNRRTAQGAYEETGSQQESGIAGYGAGGSARRGRGAEDDAWDSQVRDEDPYGGAGAGAGGYYEEQELGLTPTPGLQSEPYGAGSSYLDARTGYENERGRSQNRSPGLKTGAGLQTGQQGHARPGSAGQNPFGDDNEAASLRDVSPRPEVDGRGIGHVKGQASLDSQHGGDSPTSTRKSMFREGL
jgi:hypothetical protein